MKIVAIIPARGGSKGVPRKNIRLLAGKPLLAYTAEAALQAKLIDRVILSTEDPEIAEVGKSLGVDVPFLRPAALAEDSTPTLPAIQHAIAFLTAQNFYFDGVCILQATSPFRPKGFIDNAIERFVAGNTDSLFSVLPVPHEFNPHWTFEPNEKGVLKIATGEKEIIPRRQNLPTCYYRNGSLYLAKTEVVMQQNSIYGETSGYILADAAYHCNIDTLADWDLAEIMAQKLKSRGLITAT